MMSPDPATTTTTTTTTTSTTSTTTSTSTTAANVIGAAMTSLPSTPPSASVPCPSEVSFVSFQKNDLSSYAHAVATAINSRWSHHMGGRTPKALARSIKDTLEASPPAGELDGEQWLTQVANAALVEVLKAGPGDVRAVVGLASKSLKRKGEKENAAATKLQNEVEKARKRPRTEGVVPSVPHIDVEAVQRRISGFALDGGLNTLIDVAAAVSKRAIDEKAVVTGEFSALFKKPKSGVTIELPTDFKENSNAWFAIMVNMRDALVRSVKQIKTPHASLYLQGNKLNGLGTYAEIKDMLKPIPTDTLARLLWGEVDGTVPQNALRPLLFQEMSRGKEIAVWLAILPFMLFERWITTREYVDLNPMTPGDATNTLSAARAQAAAGDLPTAYLPPPLMKTTKELIKKIFQQAGTQEPRHERTKIVLAFLDALIRTAEDPTNAGEPSATELLSTPPNSP